MRVQIWCNVYEKGTDKPLKEYCREYEKDFPDEMSAKKYIAGIDETFYFMCQTIKKDGFMEVLWG